MNLTEFNAEEVIQDVKAEGREEAKIEAAQNLLKMNILTPEQIAQAQGLPLEKVLELQKELAVIA